MLPEEKCCPGYECQPTQSFIYSGDLDLAEIEHGTTTECVMTGPEA